MELSHDAAAFGIHFVTTIFEESAYSWPEVNNIFLQRDAFTTDLLDFYRKIMLRRVTPSVLVRIDQAYVRDFQVACGPREVAALIYETYRVPDRVVAPPLEPLALVGCDEARFSDPDVDHMLFTSSGSFNYGHWLVDDLPKIRAAIDRLAHGGRPIRLLLASHGTVIDQVRMDTIQYMIDDDRLSIAFFDKTKVYAIRNLYLATPVTCHPLDKSVPAMRYLGQLGRQRERFARPTHALGARKLFVARPGANTRSLLNVDAVWDVLRTQGFVLVDPGQMSFAEQVSAFAAAQTIIGVMGAGMTNTVFCSPQARISYLAPRGWIETFYLDLAAACGHRYRVVYGALDDPDQPPYLSRFSISDDDLAMVLSDLGDA
ncbi:glycosyltransferase family 61 protein [Sphingomonas bacterium]|uniref:glycosyltransferase family 61 protein n=1 Tax=Sphingomonas bacterium TaxID=1895847 RepID=UPI001576D5DE|nr:glycosyltransferase family 61 protein [Sphingomonas bacterium]